VCGVSNVAALAIVGLSAMTTWQVEDLKIWVQEECWRSVGSVDSWGIELRIVRRKRSLVSRVGREVISKRIVVVQWQTAGIVGREATLRKIVQ